MNKANWPVSEQQIVIRSVGKDLVSQKIWDRCYMPFISETSGILYYDAKYEEIGTYLRASGIPSRRIKKLSLDDETEATKYYPSSEVMKRTLDLSYRPMLVDAEDKFALRCFDDFRNFCNNNSWNYHQGKITDEERLERLADYKKECVSLPDWQGMKPINWDKQLY